VLGLPALVAGQVVSALVVEGGRTTLLYAAHDPAHNNAVVLADYLRDQAGRQHVRHSA